MEQPPLQIGFPLTLVRANELHCVAWAVLCSSKYYSQPIPFLYFNAIPLFMAGENNIWASTFYYVLNNRAGRDECWRRTYNRANSRAKRSEFTGSTIQEDIAFQMMKGKICQNMLNGPAWIPRYRLQEATLHYVDVSKMKTLLCVVFSFKFAIGMVRTPPHPPFPLHLPKFDRNSTTKRLNHILQGQQAFS